MDRAGPAQNKYPLIQSHRTMASSFLKKNGHICATDFKAENLLSFVKDNSFCTKQCD
jgi:hypothetical protein